jgi:hypothetical protein
METADYVKRMRILAGFPVKSGLVIEKDYFIPARESSGSICVYCGTRHNQSKDGKCKNCGAPIK